MSSVIDKVNQRTQLVGENRLEILMFKLQEGQTFALNVFKIQEIQRMPKLTVLPESHPCVVGVTYARGRTIPVIDLSFAIGMAPLEDRENCNVIISEYNMTVQAFMVKSVDRIINMNWEDVSPPPGGAGRHHYLTAITQVNKDIVEIIDVEKVLQEITPYNAQVSEGLLDDDISDLSDGLEVLVVDDSSVGLSQVKDTVDQLGLTIRTAGNGKEALKYLKKRLDEIDNIYSKLALVITDAEMPEMDGYRLTTEIRNDPRMKDLYVVLHTSLSGDFNNALVEKVGCNAFLSKFQSDKLALCVQERIRDVRKEYPK